MTTWAFPGDVAGIAEKIGSSLMPDNEQWINRFTVSSSSSSAVYTVAQRRSDGVWGCSCWGWKRHRHCKHLADILQRLSALAPAVPEAKAAPSVVDMLGSAQSAYEMLGGIH